MSYSSSVVYLLLHPLDAVVPVGGPVVGRSQHDLPHPLRRLDLAELQEEEGPEVVEGGEEEAGEAGAGHQAHEVVDVLVVPPGQEEALDDQGEVELEGLAVHTAPHDPDHLLGELEVRPLEPEVVGWGNAEDEAEVDVHQEPLLLVHQDVAVVPVLHLQDVGHHRVRRLRPDEVLPRLLEPLVVLRPEVAQEELVERLLVGLADRVPGDAVGHHLDDAPDVEGAASAVGQGVVGEEGEAELVPAEYLKEELYDLEGEAVLADVVEHLEDAGNLLLLAPPLTVLGLAPTGQTGAVPQLAARPALEAGVVGEVAHPAAHDGHAGHGLGDLLLRQVLLRLQVQCLLLPLALPLLEVLVGAGVGGAVEGEEEGALGCALHGGARVLPDAEHLEGGVEGEVGALGGSDLHHFRVDDVLLVGRGHLRTHLP